MRARIALIGVGGKGVRMGRSDIQKCLIPIEGVPIVEYVLERLHECGIKLILLLSGFHHDQVAAYISGVSFERSVVGQVYGGVDGENPAICRLQSFLKGEEFIYLGGDCIFAQGVIEKLLKCAERRPDDAAIVLATFESSMAPTHEHLNLDGERIVKVMAPDDPSAGSLAVMGTYYIRPKSFKFLRMVPPENLGSAFLQKAIDAGETVSVCPVTTPWFCIHTQDDLEKWNTSPMRKFLLGL